MRQPFAEVRGVDYIGCSAEVLRAAAMDSAVHARHAASREKLTSARRVRRCAMRACASRGAAAQEAPAHVRASARRALLLRCAAAFFFFELAFRFR